MFFFVGLFYKCCTFATVNSSLQTSVSILWLTTFGGFVRYDGLRFELFNSSGLGLNGIAERVKILNGICEITSETNKGTVVSVTVPLK